MANFRIWAPWRLAYVKDAAKDNEEECIFCAKPAADADEENLIVHRGEHSFVILGLLRAEDALLLDVLGCVLHVLEAVGRPDAMVGHGLIL